MGLAPAVAAIGVPVVLLPFGSESISIVKKGENRISDRKSVV